MTTLLTFELMTMGGSGRAEHQQVRNGLLHWLQLSLGFVDVKLAASISAPIIENRSSSSPNIFDHHRVQGRLVVKGCQDTC